MPLNRFPAQLWVLTGKKISKSFAVHGAGAGIGDALKDEVAERGEGGARGGGHRDYYAIIHIIAGKQKANFDRLLKTDGSSRTILECSRNVVEGRGWFSVGPRGPVREAGILPLNYSRLPYFSSTYLFLKDLGRFYCKSIPSITSIQNHGF